MATEFSFDIVSKPNMQEVKNALQAVEREIETRYDFKGSISKIDHEDEKLTLHSDNDARLDALRDVLQSKFIKRGLDIKYLDFGKIEDASKGALRQVATIRNGIATDKAKQLVKLIKDKGLKVQAQIQDGQVRVTGKTKDELQAAMSLVKGSDLDYPVEFTNYR